MFFIQANAERHSYQERSATATFGSIWYLGISCWLLAEPGENPHRHQENMQSPTQEEPRPSEPAHPTLAARQQR